MEAQNNIKKYFMENLYGLLKYRIKSASRCYHTQNLERLMPADYSRGLPVRELTVPGEVHPRLYGKIFKLCGMTPIVHVLIRD
jgi:hypothetical protein